MGAVSDVHTHLTAYLAARGLTMPSGASARKVAEEATELVEVCAADQPDPVRLRHEVADVVLAAAVVAHHHGFTVEEALRSKIDHDTGREPRTAIEVVGHDPAWAVQFATLARDLSDALAGIEGVQVEHVGSTSVPGLVAKPVLDVDVLVEADQVPAAVAALESVGYVHRGDLGVSDREAFHAPDDGLRRHVYVCVRGTLHVRNHLAVREVLRRRADLREAYGEVKSRLAAVPGMDTDTYLAGKSQVLQQVLAESDLSEAERLAIWRLNDPAR